MKSKYYSDPAVAKDVLSETFQRVVQDPGIGESLKELDQLVAFDYTQDDPSLLFWMDARGGQVSIGTDQPPEPATVTMVSSLDVGHQSWSNKLNPMMAIATRKIKPKGNATSLLKLAPLLKKIAPIYNQVLDDKGLGDIKL